MLALALAVALVLLRARGQEGGELLTEAAFPAALAVMPDGSLAWGERLTGRIVLLQADGSTVTVATVDVRTDGEQRGLVGLAADDTGRLFAAWTRAGDGRLVVAEVAPERRDVWIGPLSADRANGGRLAFAPDGGLMIGIGDLLEPERVADPAAPNGKLLALDADSGPDQRPDVVSAGWNNPFAFAFAPDGTLWVADNAGGEGEERIAMADPEPEVVGTLPPHSVPSGLVALSGRSLLVCTYLGRELLPIDVSGAEAAIGEPVADDCAIGVVALPDGRLAYANETEIRVLELEAATP